MEFEGRNPINGDFHGIRQLLQQLFLKSEINLSEMSDIITGKRQSAPLNHNETKLMFIRSFDFPRSKFHWQCGHPELCRRE